MNKEVIVVVGPTASGKSDFAVDLALQHHGEIISADSRQIYRGLDIGTGKITLTEMKGVPHYMLDIADIHEDFSVAKYKELAFPIVEDILARGKTPIICGGTGFYVDALIFTTTFPEVVPNLILRKELEQKTTEELFAILKEQDEDRAEGIDKHNRVRLIRALEIVEALGKVPPLTEASFRYPTTIYLLSPEKDILRARIQKRLNKRLDIGMINEVKSLYEHGFTSEAMKKFGLEYEIIGKYLEGIISESQMKEEIVTKSMQYAKRQETWNKKYLPFAHIVTIVE